MMTKVPLGEVAHIAMGSAPPGTSYNEIGQGIPMIAGAGDYGSIHPHPKKWTTEPSRITNVGDLIVCVRATIGDLNWADKKYCLGRGVAGLRGKEGQLDINFAAHYINAKKKDLLKLGTGSTFLAIRRSDLEEFEIPLPPLPEQRRIATILDKADAIRRKRQQAIRLTEEFLRSVFLGMFGDPVLNPKGWEVKPLGTISKFENGDRSKNYPSGDDIKLDGILFLSTKNIVKGKLDLRVRQFITEEKYQSLSQGKAQQNDLLITLRGTLGNCCVFDSTYDKAFINAQMMIIRPGEKCQSDFLHSFLTSAPIKELFQRIGQGAAVPQLTATQLRVIDVPLPPFDLQVQFSNVKKKVESSIERMTTSSDCKLFESLVQRAFKGELLS